MINIYRQTYTCYSHWRLIGLFNTKRGVLKNRLFQADLTWLCSVHFAAHVLICWYVKQQCIVNLYNSSKLYYNKSQSINTTIPWDSNIIQYIWLHVSAYLILSHLQANRLQNSRKKKCSPNRIPLCLHRFSLKVKLQWPI